MRRGTTPSLTCQGHSWCAALHGDGYSPAGGAGRAIFRLIGPPAGHKVQNEDSTGVSRSTPPRLPASRPRCLGETRGAGTVLEKLKVVMVDPVAMYYCMITTRRIMIAIILYYQFEGAAHSANLTAVVSIREQRMRVIEQGVLVHDWPVSTARAGKVTPLGEWMPEWYSENHRSSLYNNAPMPWSIFFHGNYAVHGTEDVDQLGQPASAGCIRLDEENARILFMKSYLYGRENTRIVVQP